MVHKLPQLVGPLVPELPGCPLFSVFGLTFPLAGLTQILLQSEDGFFFAMARRVASERGRSVMSNLRWALSVFEHVDKKFMLEAPA